MPSATTIAEALDTLPSSSSLSSHNISPTRRAPLLLLNPTVRKNKFDSPTSASSHRPAALKWVPSHPQHLLSRNSNRSIDIPRRVKESILITGRDAGVKQSLKFKCRLPLPFLEQNGPHDEDLIDNTPEENDDSGDNEGREMEEEGGRPAMMTLSDLEMDLDTPDSPPAKPTPKRRRISKHHDKDQEVGGGEEEDELYDTLPADFLKLLKAEIPGGKSHVSPGDFARVWKMSGRAMGNELVLAQNEYFDASRARIGKKKKGRQGEEKLRRVKVT
ncbi:hypothetical protein TWF730_001798 [Orbilia blumenaviensis]|uniref:Uncharacterized protein n=1 Tax=Orbilia blumenaviensis TaxID=1796055 RepID=A0AAV9UCH9_9PEZI